MAKLPNIEEVVCVLFDGVITASPLSVKKDLIIQNERLQWNRIKDFINKEDYNLRPFIFTPEEKNIWLKNPYCLECQIMIKLNDVNNKNIQINDENNLAHKNCPEQKN